MQSRPVALSWALLVSCSAPQTGDRLTNPETGLLDSTETDSGLVDTGSPWTDTGEDTEDLDTAAETTPPSDTGDTDPPDPPEIDPCDGLPFGVCWVRTHPMMIAGLVVSMDSPPGSEVERFYQDFGANTVQFWADALPTEVDSWASVGHPDFAWVAWIDASGISYGNNQALGGVGADPAGRVGYQVGDEPRTLDELEGIQQGIDTVRAEDPDALVIVNFGNGET